MSAKVTMQDIADALGFSRNTVSKAINNTGVISPTTKELILKKAAEMGYRNLSAAGIISVPAQVSQIAEPNPREKKIIAMLTCSMLGGSHFAVTTLDRMQQILSHHGYSLAFYRITPEELREQRLPGSIDIESTAAIFCVELFDYDYCKMLSGLNIPLLLIDSPTHPDKEPLSADILLMENKLGIYYFISQIAKNGKKSVGYVGDMMHCRSFFERGAACISAAAINGLLPAERYSIPPYRSAPRPKKEIDYLNYTDDIFDMLRELPELPEVFVCANDFIAIHLISALRRMGIRCPEDILVMGFDDSPESRFHTPSLTTVHIHTQTMGDIAAEMILGRIAEPDRKIRTVYSKTELILRQSTEMEG